MPMQSELKHSFSHQSHLDLELQVVAAVAVAKWVEAHAKVSIFLLSSIAAKFDAGFFRSLDCFIQQNR
ncbi:hypothetical protein Nepgr_015959 [Nepenthes gracilis]|uniref:Uncharacterized protein n=1 Tax=Nepenthes gracilis TaxID=150966 RepID=A0AAD3SLW0_NEPGR|nr:hypothetical protein Nepgr_015959 [Nepenthes gracilis]